LKDVNGGRATEENGALLRNMNHQWFNRLSKERQEDINEMFQEYKRRFRLNVATVTTEGIKNVQQIELPVLDENDCIEIKLEPMTKEEQEKYEEYKRKRNEKVFSKFSYERE
jgi:TRAP-type C4-dicarboxylate transport system substrate-binding protein